MESPPILSNHNHPRAEAYTTVRDLSPIHQSLFDNFIQTIKKDYEKQHTSTMKLRMVRNESVPETFLISPITDVGSPSPRSIDVILKWLNIDLDALQENNFFRSINSIKTVVASVIDQIVACYHRVHHNDHGKNFIHNKGIASAIATEQNPSYEPLITDKLTEPSKYRILFNIAKEQLLTLSSLSCDELSRILADYECPTYIAALLTSAAEYKIQKISNLTTISHLVDIWHQENARRSSESTQSNKNSENEKTQHIVLEKLKKILTSPIELDTIWETPLTGLPHEIVWGGIG